MIIQPQEFIAGAQKLADIVGSTLGPNGKLVAHRTVDGVRMTKDGVTVAEFVESSSPGEQMGIEFMRSAAQKLLDAAGDGTTSVTVLTQALINEGLTAINSNPAITPNLIARYFDDFRSAVQQRLEETTSEITPDRLADIVRVSSNSPELATVIMEAIDIVGQDGIIEVLDSETSFDKVEHVNGVQWKKGYVSTHFSTDENTLECFHRDAAILIFDGVISTPEQISPIYQFAAQSATPVILIANDFTEVAMSVLIMNKIRRGIAIVPVKGPLVGQSRSDFYSDLGVLTGARVFSEKTDPITSEFNRDYLGFCEKVKIDQSSTTIVNPKGNPALVKKRIESLKTWVNLAETSFDRDAYLDRIGRLANRVVLLYIGGTTPIEIQERRERVEDALKASRQSMQSGYVPGGGSALYFASRRLERDGSVVSHQLAEAFERALEYPLRKIAENSGKNPDIIISGLQRAKTRKHPLVVWNAETDTYEAAQFSSIVDPATVTKHSLNVAVRTAVMALNLSYVLSPEIPIQDRLSSMAL